MQLTGARRVRPFSSHRVALATTWEPEFGRRCIDGRSISTWRVGSTADGHGCLSPGHAVRSTNFSSRLIGDHALAHAQQVASPSPAGAQHQETLHQQRARRQRRGRPRLPLTRRAVRWTNFTSSGGRLLPRALQVAFPGSAGCLPALRRLPSQAPQVAHARLASCPRETRKLPMRDSQAATRDSQAAHACLASYLREPRKLPPRAPQVASASPASCLRKPRKLPPRAPQVALPGCAGCLPKLRRLPLATNGWHPLQLLTALRVGETHFSPAARERCSQFSRSAPAPAE